MRGHPLHKYRLILAGNDLSVSGNDPHFTVNDDKNVIIAIVMGCDYVGGIAGKDETGGEISDCRASGVVRGSQFTGGIAGQNSGTLLNCANTAAVNTAVSEDDMAADLENIESTLYNLLKSEDVTENAVTTDTGGIAGYSNGILQSCVNTGAVGYPHVGYNVGGIAGRQNGYMASCINRGTVQGRKDVGGIVGQMAPDITLQFTSGSLDELQNELNGLHNVIDRTLDDAQSASNTVSGRISRISGYADNARDSAHSMTGQLGDFVDTNVDTVNNIMLLVERYLAKAAPIMEDLAAASDSTAQAVAAMRQLLDTLKQIVGYLRSAMGSFADASGHFSNAMNALADAMGTLREINAQMDTVFA